MDAKRYGLAVAIAALTLATLFLLDHIVPLPRGYLISLAENLAELAAATTIFYRIYRSPIKRWNMAFLGCYFLFLLIGDFAYSLSYFVFKRPSEDLIVALCTKIPYSLAFLSAFCCQLSSIARRNRWDLFKLPVFWILVLLSAPVAVRFLGVPFLSPRSGTPFAVTLVEGIDVVALVLLFWMAMGVFLSSRSYFWTLFSTGVITLVVGDWAIRVESSLAGQPAFGFYETQWALGIFLSALPLYIEKGRLPEIHPFETRSLLNTYKLASLLLGLIPVLFICLSQQNSIVASRIIALGLSTIALFAGLVSHFLIDKISYFTDGLGKLLQATGSSAIYERSEWVPAELRSTFMKVSDEVRLRQRQQEEMRISEATHELARQVAHDIRSPLTALEITLSSQKEITERERNLIRTAASRIREIADSLLSKKHSLIADDSSKDLPVEPEQLLAVIGSLCAEKRVAISRRPAVYLEEVCPYNVFVSVRPRELKRVLSNLIDNAFEAIVDKGKVQILVETSSEGVKVSIVDNGKGIPPEVLPTLMRPGQSFSKPSGNGLGLSSAKAIVEKWGSALSIASELGMGTTLSFHLNEVTPPAWHQASLQLDQHTQVVIADDDRSIHDLWGWRLSPLNLTLSHCTSLEELKKAVEKGGEPGKALYLVDQEFRGDSATGFDAIRELAIEAHSILVTANYDSRTLRANCVERGVRILPKSCVPFIPIEIGSSPIWRDG